MALNTKWVPIKWPCGPLEITLLDQFNNANDENRWTAMAWAQPSTLQLLKGTPINCLVVDWALGVHEDAEQHRTLKPLIAKGRELGLSFVGKISTQENLQALVESARLAGLEAVLLESPADQELSLPVILQNSSDSIAWETATSVFVVTDNPWPGASLKVVDENMDGDTAIAGPTGVPWVDSNSWLTLLSQQMAPGKMLWIDVDPPESRGKIPATDYSRAISDAQIYGGRWVISLDAAIRTGLLKKDQSAIDLWNQISSTLVFFDHHADWVAYQPMGILAVVSDFNGQNAYTSGQVLTLLNRRQMQFVVMSREHPLVFPGEWLKGLLWLDDKMPDERQREQLLRFVQSGGLVISSHYWGPPDNRPYAENWLPGYSIYTLEVGKMVVAESGLPDPYQIARDAHLLVSRKNDFVRLYNPGSTKFHASISPDGQKLVVQILNYSMAAANYVTLWLNEKARAAQLWRPGLPASSSLQQKVTSEGTNFDLPEFSVMCAIEAERQSS
jgi:hypothetical protein